MKKTIKFLAVILVFTLLIPCFAGCGGDGFKQVNYVTFTCNGKERTLKSLAFPEDKLVSDEITWDEYSKNKNASHNIPKAPIEAKGKATYTCYVGGEKYIYYWHAEAKRGFKYWYTGNVTYKFVFVKIVDDDTISIREVGGRETTYTVSSYRVDYYFE